ncbi:MAG TPA: hypothetical protein VK486_01750, partial [Thermoleophilaceae bacterium]|nr:hypothetical protein [Thermoleophilaceae bacterium]
GGTGGDPGGGTPGGGTPGGGTPGGGTPGGGTPGGDLPQLPNGDPTVGGNLPSGIPVLGGTPSLGTPAKKAGKCSKLKGAKRAKCIKKACGRYKGRTRKAKLKYASCVKAVTRKP